MTTSFHKFDLSSRKNIVAKIKFNSKYLSNKSVICISSNNSSDSKLAS